MALELELHLVGKEKPIRLPGSLAELRERLPVHKIRVVQGTTVLLEVPTIPGWLSISKKNSHTTQLETRTPCFFEPFLSVLSVPSSSIEVTWEIDHASGLSKLEFESEEVKLGMLSGQGGIGPIQVDDQVAVQEADFFGKLISSQLVWNNPLWRPGSFRPAQSPTLNLYLWRPCGPDPLPLMPVFEVKALPAQSEGNDKARLRAFDRWIEVAGPDRQLLAPVTLLQVPAQLVVKERAGDRRSWFLAMAGLPAEPGFELWNDTVEELLRSAHLLSPGAPATHVPRLHDTPGSGISWTLAYRLDEQLRPYSGPGPRPTFAAVGEIGAERADIQVASWAFVPRVGSGTASQELEAEFPSLKTHDGISPRGRIRIDPSGSGTCPQAELQMLAAAVGGGGGLYFRAEEKWVVEASRPGNMRIGALDVVLSAKAPRKLGVEPEREVMAPHVRMKLQPSKNWAGRRLPQGIAEVSILTRFRLAGVLPGGQDKSADPFPLACEEVDLDRFELPEPSAEREAAIDCAFARQQPLVIPNPFSENPASPSDLVLEIKEERTESTGLRLDLKIFADSPENKDAAGNAEDICTSDRPLDRVAVLDPDPFFTAVVAYEPLGSLRSETGSEVANWSSHGLAAGTWHLHLPSRQGFCLTLPPQGVGETMERYQTLGNDDLADFRLAPPARLSMRAAYFEQSFPEAPWNLRNLLTNPGRELPGAELEIAQLELLYGLSCHFDVHRDLVRLAEVLTLVGDVPGPLPDAPWSSVASKWLKSRGPEREAWDRARLRWSRFHRQLRARLAVFETWDAARLATLNRREGVTCWIRAPKNLFLDHMERKPPKELGSVPSAELAHPIETLGSRSPQAGPNTKAPADLCSPEDGSLCGGVTWGFESRNVFEAVVPPRSEEWPRSTAAELTDLRLSALGAWGHQMAAFDAGRTTIYGDVAMGRTYAYRVERLGRIGCFWHRAKHVIIYERTVVPSRQFVGDQNPLGGRPILRKVREYVEILENKRTYPDTAEATQRQVGFIRRVTFAEQPDEVVRFHVKSAWGTDLSFDNGNVEEKGWKVPLWIEGAEPVDVFPRPRVRVTVLSVIDGETREVERYLDNPENLVFFTRTTDPKRDDKAADTNGWPPVPGIDWVDRARPRTQKDPAFEEGRLDQRAAGDRLVPAGHAPTTFLLEPSPHGANLTVHREGEAMAAAVRSFTMTRSAEPAGQTADAPEDSSLEAVTRGVEASFAKVLAKLPGSGALGKEQLDEISKALGGVATEAGNLRGQIEQARKGIQDLSPEQMIKTAQDAGSKAASQALERLVGASGDSELEKALRAVVEQMLRDGNLISADRLKAILEQELAAVVAGVGQKVTLLVPSPLVLSTAMLPPIRTAVTGLEHICEDGTKLRDKAQAGWNEAAATPERLEREIRVWLEEIERVLDSVAAASQAGPTVQVGDKRLTIPGLARPVADKIRGGLVERVNLCRQAADWLRHEVVLKKVALAGITTELEERVKTPVTTATSALDQLCKLGVELRSEAKKIEGGIEELEGQKRALIDVLEEELMQQGRILIEQIVGGARDVNALVGTWIEPARAWLTCTEGMIQEQASVLERKVAEVWKPQAQKVENAVNDVKTRAETLKGELKGKAEDIRRKLEQERDLLLADLERNFGDELRVLEKLKAKAEEVRAKAEPGLRLIRAFGTPPEVGGLQFDRPEVAFFYKELDNKVGITPVIGRVAQAAAIGRAVGDVLEPLGVDLPVKELGEKLLPADLRNFDLASIFPNFAGLRLDKLFSGLKMPDLGESVKVQHGIDIQTRRAWFHAEINTKIDKEAVVFATGPLSLAIVEPIFSGRVRADVDESGAVRRKVEGEISGDWKMTIGGTEILIIHKSRLEFDEGGQLHFRIRPEQIELPAAMKFISELLAKLSDDASGLTIRIEPTGISSILSLPLPDIQAGSFGISGLSLGATLALRWIDSDPQGRQGFSIGLAFNLAFPDRPFALTIFILGGGGYLTVESKYFPTTGAVNTEVSMAITASASLAITLRVISGGVFVYFGITARYTAGQGGLYVGVLFLIVGRVSVLGIVSASVRLSLAAEYTPDGGLLGHGHVSLEIKICWCFTLRVSKDVTYELNSGGGSSRLDAPAWGPRPVARVASLGSPAVLPAAGGMAESDACLKDSQFLHLREQVRRHLAMLA